MRALLQRLQRERDPRNYWRGDARRDVWKSSPGGWGPRDSIVDIIGDHPAPLEPIVWRRSLRRGVGGGRSPREREHLKRNLRTDHWATNRACVCVRVHMYAHVYVIVVMHSTYVAQRHRGAHGRPPARPTFGRWRRGWRSHARRRAGPWESLAPTTPTTQVGNGILFRLCNRCLLLVARASRGGDHGGHAVCGTMVETVRRERFPRGGDDQSLSEHNLLGIARGQRGLRSSSGTNTRMGMQTTLPRHGSTGYGGLPLRLQRRDLREVGPDPRGQTLGGQFPGASLRIVQAT